MEGVQYIWGTPEDNGGKPMNNLCTALLEESVPYVCNICTPLESRDDYDREFILQLENYNRVISSFRFLPSGPLEKDASN
jgi:hypothetical protein